MAVFNILVHCIDGIPLKKMKGKKTLLVNKVNSSSLRNLKPPHVIKFINFNATYIIKKSTIESLISKVSISICRTVTFAMDGRGGNTATILGKPATKSKKIEQNFVVTLNKALHM